MTGQWLETGDTGRAQRLTELEGGKLYGQAPRWLELRTAGECSRGILCLWCSPVRQSFIIPSNDQKKKVCLSKPRDIPLIFLQVQNK